MRVSNIAKAAVAAAGAITTALIAAFADDVIDITETRQLLAVIGAQAVTVYGVWKVRNTP